MKNLRPLFRAVGLSLTLSVVSAGAASAYSYGTLTVSHDGSDRGKGYGSFSRSGYNGASLTASLADLRSDDTRTYAAARGTGIQDWVVVQSGRRSGGPNGFAPMQTKYGYAAGSTYNFSAYVKVCQDVNFATDWCSSSATGRL